MQKIKEAEERLDKKKIKKGLKNRKVIYNKLRSAEKCERLYKALQDSAKK